jgi:hypothetical protein
MLTEQEWAEVGPLLSKVMHDVKKFRETTGASVDVAVRQGFERAVLEKYRELTGSVETNVNALWHHRLADVKSESAMTRWIFRWNGSKRSF